MKMKLTKLQQEMYDGKHGEAKKFCMLDFGQSGRLRKVVE